MCQKKEKEKPLKRQGEKGLDINLRAFKSIFQFSAGPLASGVSSFIYEVQVQISLAHHFLRFFTRGASPCIDRYVRMMSTFVRTYATYKRVYRENISLPLGFHLS